MITRKLLSTTIALVLVVGLVSPAFGQTELVGDPATTPTPGAGATFHQFGACIVLDFEGGGDQTPAGVIGPVTFSANGLTIIDADALGGSGNFANEPSPDTILFTLVGPTIVATLASPVSEISWNYFSPFAPAQIEVFGAGNVLLATIPLAQIPSINPGDPNGQPFDTWASGSHTEAGGEVITRVDYTSPTNQAGWDDLDYCMLPELVGGEFSSMTTSALLLAGTQNMVAWMIPLAVAAAGIGLVIARKL